MALERLAELEDEPALQRYQPYWAAQADLLRRAGRIEDAAAAYRKAIDFTGNDSERRFLQRRLDSLPDTAG